MEEEEEEEEDVDIETIVSSEDNDLSCGEQNTGSALKGELTCHFAEVIEKATRTELWVLQSTKTSGCLSLSLRRPWRCVPHQRKCPACLTLKTWCAVDLIHQQLRISGVRFSNMHDREQVACRLLPPVDQALAPLVFQLRSWQSHIP